jgi:hypothetical protein
MWGVVSKNSDECCLIRTRNHPGDSVPNPPEDEPTEVFGGSIRLC